MDRNNYSISDCLELIVDTLSADAIDAQTEFTTSDFQNVSNYLKNRSNDIDVRTLSDYFGVTPTITFIPPTVTNKVVNTPVVTSIPSTQPGTGSNYIIEIIRYHDPNEARPIEVVTPEPTETPDFNTRVTIYRQIRINPEVNSTVTKEPQKGILDEIIAFFRRFVAL
jgi:hypothetical protein